MEELIKALKENKSKENLYNIIDYLKANSTIDDAKYTKELIQYILEQKIEIEAQTQILLYYIDLLFSFSIKSEQLNQMPFRQIFCLNNSFYNEISNDHYISAYYNINYPKKDTSILTAGTQIDYLQIENSKYYSWTQGEIIGVNDTIKQYTIQLPITTQPQLVNYDSFRIQPLNTFTLNDFKWRQELAEGDIIDALDTGNRWNRSTILSISRKRNDILVGLRVYETESKIKYTGYGEFYDFTCSIYDSKIRLQGTFSPVTHFPSLYAVMPQENNKFNSHSMHIPFDNTHYVIPKYYDDISMYSLEYITIANKFISNLIGLMNKEKNVLLFSLEQIDYFIAICHILFNIHEQLHPDFSKVFIPEFIMKAHEFLIAFSKSDTSRNFTKASISIVIQNFRSIMEMAYYPWEISSHVASFEISFGMNCLSSSIMEKQLLGLKIISDSLTEGTKQYSSNEKLRAISSLLIRDEKRGNIFDILFKGNFHSEIIKKSSEVTLLLFKLRIINKEEIDQLYSLMHTTSLKEVKEIIYEILSKGSSDISSELLFHTINKLYEIDQEDITTDDIHLLVEVTKNIPESCWYNTAVQLLDFLLDIIFKGNQDHFIKPFCELISYSDKNETLVKIYLLYFEKIINSLSSQAIYIQMMLLSNLIERIPKRIEDEVIPRLSNIIFNPPEHLSQLIIEFCKVNNNKVDILTFVIKIIEASKNNSILSNDFFQSLFELYTGRNHNTDNMIFFFNWLKDLESKNMCNRETIDFFFTLLKFNHNIQDIQSNPSLYKEILNFFWHLFVSINSLNPKDFKSNQINPLELKYGDLIWTLLFNSEKQESLISCYMEMYSFPWIPQKDRSLIWEQVIKKALNDMTHISSVTNTNLNVNIKKNCIRILSDLIESSDVFGTANCRPHSALLELSEVKIEIANEININCTYTFNLSLPSNLTLYDLRVMISERIKMPLFSFGIYRFLDVEIKPKSNGRTLGSLLMSSCKLKLKKSDYITIEKKPLTIDDNNAFRPEARKVFEEVFKAFSTNGKMNRDQNCKMISTLIAGSSRITPDDSNVKKMFEKDDDNDGLLTESNLIDFYLEALKEKKDEIVWKNINNFNYRNDLRHISEPFENDIYINEDKTLMPRYILSKHKQYFNQLFELQNDSNSDVSDAANGLIDMLETNEGINNQIITNTSSAYLINAQDKVFELIYIFEIISSVVNSNDKETGSLFLKSFITPNEHYQSTIKSSFEQVIEIFIKHMAQLIDGSKALMKLYSLELKLIKTCLASLIKDTEIDQLLLHFQKEIDSVIPIINRENVFKVLMTKPNLQLEQLVKVIIGNMDVLNNKEKLVDMKRPSLIFAFQILTMILLAFKDIDLQINDFLINQLKTQFQFAQRLSYVIMKVFFIQCKDNDKDSLFMTQNKAIITKEIFNNNIALNKYNPIYVFKTYQEVIAIKQYSFEQKIEIIKDIIKELSAFINVYTEDIIIGYCSLLNTIITPIEVNSDIVQEIVLVLINKFLINDKEFNYQFSSTSFTKEVFGLLCVLITKSSSSLLLLFFNTKFSELPLYITQLEGDKRRYDISIESKSSLGYIGIKNLGSICYMISILQQFFFIKPFRYCINESSLPLDSDTPLYQLKKMFSFLALSNRKDYSPHEFANSFKDSDGQPIDIRDQYDAQEFLSRFLDKMETTLWPTQFKYLLSGVFGGESCSQLFCKNPDCDKISNSFENMTYLSLEIKEMNTLHESLKKYISQEQIDDYYCEKCKMKSPHLKRVSINKLPNVLIIHLQRIAFDYETFQMNKIDSKLEYPKELNMKEFCTESLQSGKIDNEEFNNRVIEREDEYYKYSLVGVVIHTGTAQFGHYFSIIKVSNEKDKEKWVKFNDSTVSEYQISKLDEDTFGGINRNTKWLLDTNQNAYLLFYEREKKTKIAYLLNGNKDDISKTKETQIIKDEIELNRELDVFIKHNKTKEESNSINHQVCRLNEESIEIVDYDTIIEKELNRDAQKMLFYDEVIKDNIKFNNDRKIFTKNFNEFIEVSINQINTLNASISQEEEVKGLYMKIHNIVLNIISKSYYVDNLPKIIESLIKIIETNPQISDTLLNEISTSTDKWLISYILIQDNMIGQAYSLYIANIILIAITSNSPEVKLAYDLIDYYLDYIPINLSRKWNHMCYLLEIFNHFSKSNSETLIQYLIDKEIVRKFCDFFLGKESPFYSNDDRTEIGNKTIKGKFAPLLSTIANILNCTEIYVPNAKDKKCFNLKQFYLKALLDEYDNASIGRIMAHFMINNEEFTLSRLNEMIPVIDSANGVSSYKSIFELIEQVLFISDDFTQLRLENLIGKPQLCFNESRVYINYYSPLLNDKETIISKIIKHSANSKDFIGFTKTIYELVINNQNLFNYIIDLPHVMCLSKKQGLLKVIRANCINVIEMFNLRKDDKFIEAISAIEKFEAEIDNKMMDNEMKISNEHYISEVMTIKRESVKRISYTCNNENVKNTLILLKGQYGITEIDEETFKESHLNPNGVNFIDINSPSYYINNLSPLLEGKTLMRELQLSPSDLLVHECIRYFIINTSNSSEYTISLKFNCNNKSHLPISTMSISISKQSIREISVLRDDDNALFDLIVIQSAIENDNPQSESQPVLLLPSPNENYDVCTINCQMCGEINLLDNSNTDLKCKACQIYLFQ